MRSTTWLAYVVIVGMFSWSCGGSEAPGIDLTPTETTLAPGQLTVVHVTSGTLPEGTLTATLGGVSIGIERGGASSVVLLVPDGAPIGDGTLTIACDGRSIDGFVVSVVEAPPVPDSAAAIADWIALERSRIAAIRGASLRPETLAMADGVDAQITAFEASVPSLSASERDAMARYLVVNAASFDPNATKGLFSSSEANVIASGARMAFWAGAFTLTVAASPVVGVACLIGFGAAAIGFGESVSELQTSSVELDDSSFSAESSYEATNAAAGFLVGGSSNKLVPDLYVGHQVPVSFTIHGAGRAVGDQEQACSRPQSTVQRAADAMQDGVDAWKDHSSDLAGSVGAPPALGPSVSMSATVDAVFFRVESISNSSVTAVTASNETTLDVTFASSQCVAGAVDVDFSADFVFDDGCHPVVRERVQIRMECVPCGGLLDTRAYTQGCSADCECQGAYACLGTPGAGWTRCCATRGNGQSLSPCVDSCDCGGDFSCSYRAGYGMVCQ